MAVSMSPADGVARYLASQPLPVPVLADRGRDLYTALGLGRTSWARLIRPGLLWKYLKLIARRDTMHEPLSVLERRLLGVLVEKALTAAAPEPLTLNAVVVGSNQRSNRDPVMNVEEPEADDALVCL